MSENGTEKVWYKVAELDALDDGRLTAVTAGVKAVCLVKFQGAYHALDNRCPHQGGPLGEGQIENDFVVCPWHGWEYSPIDGSPPGGYADEGADTFEVEERADGVYVGVEPETPADTISMQMMEVAAEWGIKFVFGMVGHSNLAVGDAIRKQEEKGAMTFIGVRHEGAASFAASAYAKLTGQPAACLGIAGPGSTNLLTGLWDAKVDRAPVIALSGQVETQVLGPGAFQEVDLAAAFASVAEWSQTVLNNKNASDLMALAIKHAIINRDVTHLIFPNEVAFAPGLQPRPKTPRHGRISTEAITPPRAELDAAINAMKEAKLITIIVGHGAREFSDEIIELAEMLEAPVITTFKAKGLIPDSHPLGCGVLGRSGTPVGSTMQGRGDVLLVLGASFSNHTGISDKGHTLIQVDADRMTLGKFHPVDIPLWGDIGVTVGMMKAALGGVEFKYKRDYVRREISARWQQWRTEKAKRAAESDENGINSALLFQHMGDVTPENAVISVDVGNNTYSFGRYFETKPGQHVLMSGYLGSIGFAFPAAIGAACAAPDRPQWAVAGDGGFGQYTMEYTTAVKYGLPIKLVLLHNGEIGKISKEQRGVELNVWATDLVNPNFADFANLCGGWGKRITKNDEIRAGLEALAAHDGPGILEVMTDALKI
jgi:thiamine pyrophosphate-dependent acetolactate synthase large subunit-like protein/nitrite reductase/ring-hydroxylating ferredoxin subunit